MKKDVMAKIVAISCIGLGASVSIAIARYLLLKRRVISANECENSATAAIEVRQEVPRKYLGGIIGKKGATIKRIREETCTSIKLHDQDDELAVVIIRGLPHNVKAAAAEIKKLSTSSPAIFSKEVHIPSGAWLSVVGTNGDVVRYISHESKATLAVKWSPHEDSSKSHITVRGSREQIDLALAMIDERIAQGDVSQQSKTVGIAGRSLLENVLPSMHNTISQEALETDSVSKELVYIQVFVSAIQSPSHFWVQKCGPKSVQLDKLISEMTDFYNDSPHQSSFAIQSPVPGDLVAAYYDGDKDWYRALIISVEKISTGMAATVFFVDFGDTAIVEFQMLCKLKPEFLVLPMQSIKCRLVGIAPAGERWSMDSIELFEKLTYLAQWKVLMAKLASDCPSNNNSSYSDLSDPKHGFTQVELIDTNESLDVDIGEELVKAGHAIRISEKCSEKLSLCT